MVTRNSTITQTDLDALATLANTVLSGTDGVGTYWQDLPAGYEFSYFDDSVLPPTAVAGSDSASSGDYSPGDMAIVRVYSFKNVSGRRHYSRDYTAASWTLGASASAIDWTWTAPSGGADGYILVTGSPTLAPDPSVMPHEFAYWQEVSTASFTDDYNGWLTSGLTNIDGSGHIMLNPVTGEAWLTVFRLMKIDLLYLAGVGTYWEDQDLLFSGPWVCAVGPRLRSDSTQARYTDIEFYFAADDHSGDVSVLTEAETGTTEEPYSLINGLSGPNFGNDLSYSLPVAGTIIGKVVWEQTGTGTGWTHSLAVTVGTATITSETWTETANSLTLDFVAAAPSGATHLDMHVTAASGDIANSGYASVVGQVVLASDDYTPVAATALHTTSAGAKISVADMDQALGPITFKGGSQFLNLNTGLVGCWAAKTMPVFGEMTLLEGMLPNYIARQGSSTWPAPLDASPEVGSPDASSVSPITPAVGAVGSIWPVYRDTDFLDWLYIGGIARKPVPFFSNGNFSEVATLTLAPGEKYEVIFNLPSNFATGRIETFGAATAKIYFNPDAVPDPLDSGSYTAEADGLMVFPTDATATAGQNNFYTVYNSEATELTFTIRTVVFTYTGGTFEPAELPLFFRHDSSGRGAIEPYSYNFGWTKGDLGTYKRTETPLSGYCLFEVRVSRKPTGEPKVIPSTGEAELAVDIGIMRGTTLDSAGTFESFGTFTIPADEAFVTEAIFWPVLEGVCLAYQASAEVAVQVRANFQPAVISKFLVTEADGSTDRYGTHSGQFSRTDTTSRFHNKTNTAAVQDQDITLPITTALLNDLEACFNAL